jgi:hypothetical protein
MKKLSCKKRVTLLIVFAVIVAAALFFYPLRSYAVMSVYSRYNYKSSVMESQGFNIDIKGGLSTAKKDWYPFVNTYDTSYEFSRYTGGELALTVLYNFGAFDSLRSSSFYNEESDYFAAFYGAYVVHDESGEGTYYGFTDGGADIDKIAQVAMFDYKYLVIQDLGCDSPVFELTHYDAQENTDYIGYSGWTRIDAKMLSNSPSHTRVEKKLGYIQYGLPQDNGKYDFYTIDLYGRMYARYFEEYESTVVIYVMGADQDIIDECDDEILSSTKIYSKE